MQKRFTPGGFVTVFVILLAPVRAHGQATEGAVLGAVQDTSGAAISGATVSVSNEGTGATRQTTTGQLGEYVVTSLPLGVYTVSVEAPGFKKAVRTHIGITVKARIRMNLALEVGELNQSVEVTSQAPLMKTDTPELGGVVTREHLQEIPVFARNYLALSALVPGTTRGPKADRRRDFAGEAVTVAGLSSEANNFIIDGISNNNEFNGGMGVAPAIDGLQEFAIQTSQYSAEFGRAGGGVINLAIKSGTNEFHGFGYDYLRNNKLDARPYDFTGTNPASAPIRRNQFGAGLGGPIRRNKIFLFGSYEGVRFPNNAITSNVVPTAAQRRGDFSSTPAIVYADPATTRTDPANASRLIRTPFPGNIIPSTRQSPIGVQLL